jgi:RNA polymerase sigma-70 factor (family 1)
MAPVRENGITTGKFDLLSNIANYLHFYYFWLVTIMPTTLPCDENVLFLRIAEGDEVAYRAAFDRYKAPFFSAAYKLTRRADLSEDIVQEVFILLWTRRDLVAAADNPVHYLFTILYNSIYASFKKVAAETQLKETLLSDMSLSLHTADPEDSVTQALQTKQQLQLLNDAISLLPRQQQLVFKLSREEGLSRGQIASQMHISPHSVKNHLQHALRNIRGYFKDHQVISLLVLCFKLFFPFD